MGAHTFTSPDVAHVIFEFRVYSLHYVIVVKLRDPMNTVPTLIMHDLRLISSPSESEFVVGFRQVWLAATSESKTSGFFHCSETGGKISLFMVIIFSCHQLFIVCLRACCFIPKCAFNVELVGKRFVTVSVWTHELPTVSIELTEFNEEKCWGLVFGFLCCLRCLGWRRGEGQNRETEYPPSTLIHIWKWVSRKKLVQYLLCSSTLLSGMLFLVGLYWNQTGWILIRSIQEMSTIVRSGARGRGVEDILSIGLSRIQLILSLWVEIPCGQGSGQHWFLQYLLRFFHFGQGYQQGHNSSSNQSHKVVI